MRGATPIVLQVVQEFRCGGDASHQQMIPGAGAGDVEPSTDMFLEKAICQAYSVKRMTPVEVYL